VAGAAGITEMCPIRTRSVYEQTWTASKDQGIESHPTVSPHGSKFLSWKTQGRRLPRGGYLQ
jgi:hypothetical protein